MEKISNIQNTKFVSNTKSNLIVKKSSAFTVAISGSTISKKVLISSDFSVSKTVRQNAKK
jgi:hypothetical protein